MIRVSCLFRSFANSAAASTSPARLPIKEKTVRTATNVFAKRKEEEAKQPSLPKGRFYIPDEEKEPELFAEWEKRVLDGFSECIKDHTK